MHSNSDGITPMHEGGRLLANRYRLLEKVGEGGAAEVYRALDQRLDRIVAIKLLRPQYTSDQASRTRFINEARTAAGLSHPNIVDIYDFGEAPDGSMFIAMQFIEGQNLKAVLQKRGRMTAAEVVSIVQQVCHALAAAHAKGLIHRDVKPQNIMIDRKGTVRLADFGIVKALSGPELTQTGMTFGTAAYLSPEQATGEPLSPASDIYSLGCVMYEMLAGAPPFTGENPAVVAYKQVWEQPRPLYTLAPEVPPSLESIVMRCLNKDPARRYADTMMLDADLMQLSSGFNQPTQAMPLPAVAIPAPTAQAAGASTYRPTATQPQAEVMQPIPVQAGGSVPPVRAQTTGFSGQSGVAAPAGAAATAAAAAPVGGQETRRVQPYTGAAVPSPAGVGAGGPPPRVPAVTYVGGSGRSGPAWIPILLALLIVFGVLLFVLAAWPGGGPFGILGGSRTPTPPAQTETPAVLPSPTAIGTVVVVEPTASAAPSETPTETATSEPPTATPEPPTPTVEALPTDTPEPAPTDTIEPVPTDTPEVLPTDTPEPQPLPTDTPEPAPSPGPDNTPVGPPPDATPATSGPSGVRLPATSFSGGFSNAGGYHGRAAQWVYGQGTQYNTMSASFFAATKPKGPATITIVGIDSEDAPKTPMRLTVNNTVVYEGPNPLPNDNASGPEGAGNWGFYSWRVQPNVLNEGNNTIRITNLDPSDQINYPIFIMIDSVTIYW